MTRPQMIRADTIDLQDHVSPSAKDHSRQGKHATPESGARHAPHQDQSIRDAERDSLDEMARGPVGSQVQRDTYGHGYSDQDDLIDDITRLGNGEAGHDITRDETIEDDTLAAGDGDDQFDDDLLDRISSSPSIDDEDIDFEFVYALHTFVATVEGQANASKGDTMVLLDDSNSYWWLVRVVKDGSIGYLPAEHIETPTERLARLNKHRNVDLSATMLGDNAEKSKNPLKKAMRRRNAKTVTFTSPTYFDAPEVDYSTEEEEDEDNFFDEDEGSRVDSRETAEDMSDDVDVTIEPLRPKQHHHSQQDQLHQDIRSVMESPSESDDLTELAATPSDDRSPSDIQEQPAHGRSRNGTVRNTDSFFKDDTVETKKISLTPNLLRDDASSATYYEQRDAAGRGSLESFDKAGHSGEKNKDDKKRKEKKSGMLSGLFKRKDRKHRAVDDDTDSSEKISGESTRSYTPPKSSSESLKDETRTTTTPSKPHASVQRTPSKLQKALPLELSPIKEAGTTESALSSPITDSHPSSLRLVKDQPELEDLTSDGYMMQSQLGDQKELRLESPAKATVTDAPTTHSDASPNMSEYNDHPDTKGTPLVEGTSKDKSGRHFDNWNADLQETRESGGITDERTGSTLSPFPSSPELHGTQEQKLGDKSEQPLIGPVWSDASLRAYLEDGSDIRDLLTIIYDKSNVVPTGTDHPIVGPLFKEESKALCEMSSRLDGMLNSWLTRKGFSCVR